MVFLILATIENFMGSEAATLRYFPHHSGRVQIMPSEEYSALVSYVPESRNSEEWSFVRLVKGMKTRWHIENGLPQLPKGLA